MVKLTVMYNLPPGADHDEFLKWRTGPHQKDNVGLPGLIKTDFYVIQDSREGPAPYRYMTEAYFPDMETFEEAFLSHFEIPGTGKQIGEVVIPRLETGDMKLLEE